MVYIARWKYEFWVSASLIIKKHDMGCHSGENYAIEFLVNLSTKLIDR